MKNNQINDREQLVPTESKNHTKLIQRHIWEAYVEETEQLRHHEEIKIVTAGDPYFCFNKFEKTCQMDLARCLIRIE